MDEADVRQASRLSAEAHAKQDKSLALRSKDEGWFAGIHSVHICIHS